jgi:hypothetical protein
LAIALEVLSMLQEQTKKSMKYTTKASSLKVCNESKGWAIVRRSSRRKVVKPALGIWHLVSGQSYFAIEKEPTESDSQKLSPDFSIPRKNPVFVFPTDRL